MKNRTHRVFFNAVLTVAAALIFISQVSHAQSRFFNDLIITHFVDWHVGSSTGITIYNPTKDSIDLSGYRVLEINQGASLDSSVSTNVALNSVMLAPGATYTMGDGSYCVPIFGCPCDQTVTFGGVNGNDAMGIVKGPWTGVSSSNWVDMVGVPARWYTASGSSHAVDGTNNGLFRYNIVRRDTHCIRYDEVDGVYDPSEADRTTSWPASFTNVVGWEVVGNNSTSLCNSTITTPDFQQWTTVFQGGTLCPGDTIVFMGETYTAPGTYTDTFASARSSTCDSLVCTIIEAGAFDSLTIDTSTSGSYNSPNGNNYNTTGTYFEILNSTTSCDTILTINLTITGPDTIVVVDSFCPRYSYTFNGETYTLAGFYQDTTQNGLGDTIYLITLTLQNEPVTLINQDLCPRDTVVINGVAYTAAGSYTDTIFNGASNGCDSILDITVSQIPDATGVYAEDVCADDTTIVNGSQYFTAGTFNDTLSNSAFNGCDSIVATTITILPEPVNIINAAICTDTTINGINYSSAGVFYDTISTSAANGCDSILQIQITALSASADSITAIICQGGDTTINDSFYNSPGTYFQTLVAINGCDSSLTVFVEQLQYGRDTIPATVCTGEDTTINGTTYNTANTFYDTIFGASFNGCDSILQIEIDIQPSTFGAMNASICENNDTTINGTTYSSAGAFFQTITNEAGCDSFLSINISVIPLSRDTVRAEICSNEDTTISTINYSSSGTFYDTVYGGAFTGCDSIVAIVITVLDTTTETINAAICPGSDTTINASTYSSAGTYTQNLTNAEGCDSVLTINISILPNPTASISAAICAGSDTTINGIVYNSLGAFIDTLPSSNGCDSFLTVNISILDTTSETINIALCPGQDTLVNTSTYSSAGTYIQNLSNAEGCDSVLTINVSILPNPTASISAAICTGSDTTINGIVYNAPGSFQDTLMASNGCDSFLTVNISNLDTTSETINIALCPGEDTLVNTTTYSSAGSFIQNLSNAEGCDSTLTINITIKPLTYDTLNIVACVGDTVNVNAKQFTADGVYYDTLLSSNGCDSFLTINVNTINAARDSVDEKICPGLGTVINGTSYLLPGTYYDTLSNAASNGCDSIVTIQLGLVDTIPDTIIVYLCTGQSYTTGNGDILNTSVVDYDTFTRVVPCDSIVITFLTISDTVLSFLDQEICYDDSVLFNGVYRNVAGTYYDTGSAFNGGCDSITIFTLTIADTIVRDTLDVSICTGSDTTINAVLYNSAGSFTQPLTRYNGCDSALIINISLVDTSSESISVFICANSDTTLNGVVYNSDSAGTSIQVLPNYAGCDSFLSISVNVLDTTSESITAFICAGNDTTINGNTYNSNGVFVQNLSNTEGCDSVLSITIIVLDTTSETITAFICAGNDTTINGSTYSGNGVFIQNLSNDEGCDSTLTINVTVLDTTSETIAVFICAGSDTNINGTTYNAGGSFIQNLTNAQGCDSTLTINITILNNTADTISANVCAGNDTTINSSTYSSAGTYIQNLTNAEGCDSILTIVINQLDTTNASVNAVICQNSDTTINGFTYNSSGTFSQSLTNAAGCDSTLNITISVLDTSSANISANICAGSDTTINGITYNSAGNYNQLLTAFNGCDSFLFISINQIPTTSETIFANICSGDDTTINGITYSTPGNKIQTLIGSNGCDSVLTIRITQFSPTIGNIGATICSGDDTTINGSTYNTVGVFVQNLTNEAGCDSTLFVTMTVLPTSQRNVTASICAGSDTTINGTTYSTPGLKIQTLTASNGCDSTLRITVVIRPLPSESISASICEDLDTTINGVIYDTAGVYSQTLVAENGCDSTLTITIIDLPNTFDTVSAFLCQAEDTTINGVFYNTSGVYNQFLSNFDGCDSTLTINIIYNDTFLLDDIVPSFCEDTFVTINGKTYNTAGIFLDTFASISGCDSVMSRQITLRDTTGFEFFDTIFPFQNYPFNGQNLTNTGQYVSIISNTQGCDSNIILNLYVIPFTRDTIDLEVCFNNDTIIAGDTLTNPGLYIVDTVIGATNGDSIVYINLSRLPIADIQEDTTIVYVCEDEVPFQLFPTASFSTSGTYGDTTFNYLGCDSIVRLRTMIVLSSIDDTLLQIQQFCAGETVNIFGQTIDESGVYQVLNQNFGFSNLPSCDSLKLYFIASFDTLNTIQPDSTLEFCVDDLPQIKSFFVEGFSPPLVNFTISDYGFSRIRTYEIDDENCIQPIDLDIVARQRPSVEINVPSTDDVISVLKDTTVTIGADGLPDDDVFYAYEWTTPGQGNLQGDLITRVISDSGLFTVRYYHKEAESCEDSDKVRFAVYEVNPFTIPSIFTPNDDGVNDRFAVIGLKNVEVEELTIFSRWGQSIFTGSGPSMLIEASEGFPVSSADPSRGWDGRYKFKDQPAGTYVYLVKVRYNGILYARTGSVTLVR